MACFVLSAIALLFISATLLARANDLRWREGITWKIRVVGLAMAGFAPWGIIGYEALMQAWPSIYNTMFRVGLMFVFLTTPGLPPWHRYVFGDESSDPDFPQRSDRSSAIDRLRDENP